MKKRKVIIIVVSVIIVGGIAIGLALTGEKSGATPGNKVLAANELLMEMKRNLEGSEVANIPCRAIGSTGKLLYNRAECEKTAGDENPWWRQLQWVVAVIEVDVSGGGGCGDH